MSEPSTIVSLRVGAPGPRPQQRPPPRRGRHRAGPQHPGGRRDRALPRHPHRRRPLPLPRWRPCSRCGTTAQGRGPGRGPALGRWCYVRPVVRCTMCGTAEGVRAWKTRRPVCARRLHPHRRPRSPHRGDAAGRAGRHARHPRLDGGDVVAGGRAHVGRLRRPPLVRPGPAMTSPPARGGISRRACQPRRGDRR